MITQTFSVNLEGRGDVTLPDELYDEQVGPYWDIKLGFEGYISEIGCLIFTEMQFYADDQPISWDELKRKFGYSDKELHSFIKHSENSQANKKMVQKYYED